MGLTDLINFLEWLDQHEVSIWKETRSSHEEVARAYLSQDRISVKWAEFAS